MGLTVMLDVTPPQWKGADPELIGRTVTYMVKMLGVQEIRVSQEGVKVEIFLPRDGTALDLASVKAEIAALMEIPLSPCPCACGVDLALGDCRRDSLPEVNAEEASFIRRGDQIQAIKSVRMRTSMGLKEAKDLCDAWRIKHVYEAIRNGG